MHRTSHERHHLRLKGKHQRTPVPWADEAISLEATELIPQLAGSRTAACTGCGASYDVRELELAQEHSEGRCQ